MQGQTLVVTTEKSAIQAATPLASATGAQAGATKGNIVNTRFGAVTVERDNPIVFPKGLLGFPERTQFCLTHFPVEKFGQFKLLQSLEEDELSFIALPLPFDNPIIERADLEAGCREMNFPIQDTAVLLIVSVHRELKQVRLSANARAPLFFHAPRRQAEQYVLHNNKYEVRHMLGE